MWGWKGEDMKIFHVADLHFGKVVYGRSMIDDQKYWVDRFVENCASQKPKAVLFAGDIYDRAAPNEEAVKLLDDMITRIAELGIEIFMIAGNHDSGQRLSFGSTILQKHGVHISGIVKKELDHFDLTDDDGTVVTFWLLPYADPEDITSALKEEGLNSYEKAIQRLLEVQTVDPAHCNVILSHQNVTRDGVEAERGGSETMVGGVGKVDYSVYDRFDYVALGHIHSPYHVGREEVRYAGTPLCYHFDETKRKDKGYVEVILRGKGKPETHDVTIQPLHRMREPFVGTKEELDNLLLQDTGRGEYVKIVITDVPDTPEICSYYRALLGDRGSVLMEIYSTASGFGTQTVSSFATEVKEKSLEALFTELYQEKTGGQSPDKAEQGLLKYVADLARQKKEGEKVTSEDIRKVLDRAKEVEAGGESV